MKIAYRKGFIWLMLVLVSSPLSVANELATEASTGIASSNVPHFESDVRPILKAMCFQCHGEDKELSGGLDLRLVRLMKHGGDSGEAIVGKLPDKSPLWLRIESDEMPEGAKKLTPKEKDTIRRWIVAGSPLLHDEPENPEDARYTPEELGFWSFQAVIKVAVPEPAGGVINNPIDAFVLEKLAAEGLTQSDRASKEVLLRRVTFDLTGLPPTPEELDAFLADDSDSAYETVVDRLLESKSFGIRWGRHWLDIAGFSETDGYLADDVLRPNAWRYRDYVIDSVNADKPYDRFIHEQLAGDELIGGEPDPDNERDVELMTATGFLQMAPDLTRRQETINDRNQVVAETIKVVSSAVLGLTVGCAQCHDHRYDPISAEDYYSLRAVFDPAFPLSDWLKPEDRVLDMTPRGDRKEIERLNTIAKQQEAELKQKRIDVAKVIYERLVRELADEHRDKLVEVVEKRNDERSEEEKKLLEQFPMFNSIERIASKLSLYDKDKFEEFFQEENKIKSLRDSGPARRIVMCVRESDDKLPESAVLSRGDPLSPDKKVSPSEVFVLARNRTGAQIPLDSDKLPSTGRRLAYARQLTDGTHPTVSRVAVNRIWSHHFGAGLVTTTSDFGLFGERPSHPELLDWLAQDFVNSVWRMKRLHKMIVMSHTFCQVSTRTTKADASDPNNRFLSRMNLRRLDAEEIRDSILKVSGLLNDQIGGPSVPVALEPDGRVVIGKAIFDNDEMLVEIADVGEQKYRRSIFIANERINTLTMLNTFDAPVMAPNCEGRECSTVAPQSLWFLNDSLILDVTEKLADRMFSDDFPEPRARILDLYRRMFSLEPTESEMQGCLEYLVRQANQLRQYQGEEWVELVKKFNHAPDVAAHATLCQSLMSTNRFLYVE